MTAAPPTLALWALAGGAAISLVGGVAPLSALIGGLSLAAVCALRGSWPLVVVLAAAGAGLALGAWRLERLAADPLRDRTPGAVRLVVTVEEPWRLSATSARADASVAGGGLVLLRIAGRGALPARGARLQVEGRLVRPRGPFRGFDEAGWLARRGIHAVLRARSFVIVGRRGGVDGAIDSVREDALGAYRGAGQDDAGQLLGSIALGADGELSDATTEAFRRSGLAHLLAVSGGNVALLVAAVLVTTWIAGLGRIAGHAAAIGAVATYVGLVGPSPSVVRAGVAGTLASVAWLGSRLVDPWHLFAAGLAVLLGWNPRTLVDPGFQLSFAAVAAILLVAPRIRDWLDGVPFPNALRTPAAISAACTLVTAPIGWWHFGRLNLIAAIPANLVALPSVPLLLWIGLAAAVVAPVDLDTATALAASARVPGAYLLAVARAGAWVDERTAWLETPLAAGLAVAAGAHGLSRAVRARRAACGAGRGRTAAR